MLGRIKGLLIGLYVPVHFAVASGHFRSAIARKALDQDGQPIPWYTYPAITYLSSLDVAGCKVLEFGGGQSSLWWADRAAHVTTVELDPEWYSYLVDHLEVGATVLTEPPEGRFDVVIVDGGNRLEAARTAIELVEPDGLIVVDDSEGYWGPGGYPIIDLMNERSYCRVDFHGYSPGVRRLSCTSLFFLPDCRLLHKLPPPPRAYRARADA